MKFTERVTDSRHAIDGMDVDVDIEVVAFVGNDDEGMEATQRIKRAAAAAVKAIGEEQRMEQEEEDA